jgi:hypothetical protein
MERRIMMPDLTDAKKDSASKDSFRSTAELNAYIANLLKLHPERIIYNNPACQEKKCKDALNRLNNHRNLVHHYCIYYRNLTEERDNLTKNLRHLIEIFNDIAAFWWVPGVTEILRIFYDLVKVRINEGEEITEMRKKIESNQLKFAEQKDIVMQNCPPECWGDLTQPKCE